QALFGAHRDDLLAKQLACLLLDRLIASDQHDRYAVRARQRRVESELAELAAVDADVSQRAGKGVAEYGGARPSPAMHADQHGLLIAAVDAVHHGEDARLA